MRKFQVSRTVRLVCMAALALLLTINATAQQNQINTVIGGGPNAMPAVDADLYTPDSVAVDSAGNFYIAAYSQNRVFKVTVSTGELTVVAGNGLQGYSGDGVTGGAAVAMLSNPEGVAVDGNGNVYIADTDNCVIRKVDTTETITTVAGVQGSCGFNGNGAPATSYELSYPEQVAVDSANNVLVADFSNAMIRKLTVSTGAISTVAGNGGSASYCTNGTAATSCSFYGSVAVAVDSSEDIFLTDYNICVVYEVIASTGKIKTVAGTNGSCGYSGDGGAATAAEIYPWDYGQLWTNSAGTQVWLADTSNERVRQFAVGGKISTVAGDGCGGFSGDGGPATSACLGPTGIALDNSGNLFIADGSYTGNERIREVVCFLGGSCSPPTGETAGDIYTVAGNGSYNDSTPVSNVPALGVTLYYPAGVLQDPSANVFVSDTDNSFVRQLVSSTGNVDLFAGDGVYGYSGDGGLATSAEISYPYGISRDSAGNIFFADEYNQVIRKVDTSGDITTVAGTPQSAGYGGDGGPATSALLDYPNDVFVDDYGNLIIADTNNHLIREVVCAATGTLTCTPPAGETAGYIYTVAGTPQTSGYAGDGGPATSSKLDSPYSAAVDGAGNLYIADTNNLRIREVNATSGIIDTIAGNGSGGFSGDGPATQNSVYYPGGLRADANGNVFFADTDNQRIRWIDGGGTMTTFAGNGSAGFSGDGAPAIAAEMYEPFTLSEDASGNFLVADQYNFRVRQINAFAAVGRSTGSISFPLQQVGTTSDAFDVTLSGIGPASITGITTSGNFSEVDDCLGGLPNGTACTVSVFFAPTKAGVRTGTLTVSTNGYLTTTTTVALQGEGEGLTITGAPMAFGNQSLGSTITKTVSIKGSTTYSSVTLSGDTTDFTISSNTCTGTVSSCSVGVTFKPLSSGVKKAALVVKDSDPTSPQLIALGGTGTTYESFTPASVSFATTVVNTNSKATKVTFKYTGSGTLTLNSLTPSTGFLVNTTGISSGACSLSGTTSIPQNGTCEFNVVFGPGSTIGTVNGTVTAAFTGDPTGNTSAQLPLIGTSTQVSLSPAAMGFGTIAQGTTKNLSVTVTNKGTTPLTFSGTPTVTGTGSGQFAVLPYASPSTSTCLNGSVTLTQNQNCTFTVQFTSPTGSTTSFTTYLNISDNGGGSPQLEKMTATN
jgi:sugar lactone lactonase YvrE